jgi:hypothetical protein
MNVCDVCGEQVADSEGYLLTTRQVVLNPTYWQFAFSHGFQSCVEVARELIGVEFVYDVNVAKVILVMHQSLLQTTPWLSCFKCAQSMGVNLSQAGEYAKLWWNSGEHFAPPENGPIKHNEIVNALNAAGLSANEAFGRALIYAILPSEVYFFGSQYLPSSEDFERVAHMLDMIYIGINPDLWLYYFRNVKVEFTNEPADVKFDRLALSRKSVDLIRQKLPPDAYMLDGYLQEVRGRDIVCIVVWERTRAAFAREFVTRRS